MGEPSAEYTAYFSYEEPEKVDEERFNRFVNLGINADDMFLRLGGSVDYRDLKPYTFPELNSLKELNFEPFVRLFVQWDVPKQSEIIMQELGWCGDHVETYRRNIRMRKLNVTCRESVIILNISSVVF